jgi:putative serine protease PepD
MTQADQPDDARSTSSDTSNADGVPVEGGDVLAGTPVPADAELGSSVAPSFEAESSSLAASSPAPPPDGFVSFAPQAPVVDAPPPLQYPSAAPGATPASPWVEGGPYSYAYGAPIPAPAPRRLRIGPIIAVSVVLALLAGLVGGVLGFALADRSSTSSGVNPSISLGSPTSGGSSSRPSDSVAGIAAAVLPSVVSIQVDGAGQSDTGSGFVVQSDGYILTNNHVIDAAVNGGTVTVFFQDGSKTKATIVGRDTAYDLAVVKVAKKGLTVLSLGNSDDLVVGDSVIAFGSPLGLSGTVTTGIVSALNRPVTAGGTGSSETSFINAIQTDAAINPGNSGGPLVDSSGAAIGVNSAIATLGGASSASGSIGVGFAIPINQARRTAEEIIKTGKSTRPVIGVTLDLNYTGPGARIATGPINGEVPITPGGPADKAGLKPGDVVLSVDGRTVAGADELIVAIRAAQPGDTVTLKVQRGGTTTDIPIVLGSASNAG